jgi:hypothetical protein
LIDGVPTENASNVKNPGLLRFSECARRESNPRPSA